MRFYFVCAKPPVCARLAWLCLVAMFGCSPNQEDAGESRAPTPDTQALTQAAPPFERYEPPPVEEAAPQDAGEAGAPPPPEALLRPWRLMMLQERPRPRGRPTWRNLPVEESGMIDMPEASRWRCLFNPVQFAAHIEESGELENWSAVRSVRCSTDGWQTYTEGMLTYYVTPGGEVTAPVEQMELFLRDAHATPVMEIVLIMRADERRRPRPIRGPAAIQPDTASATGSDHPTDH